MAALIVALAISAAFSCMAGVEYLAYRLFGGDR